MTRSKLPSSRVNLVSLRVLVAAIEEGNFARAAEREHIAISGVSRRIAELELRWGVQLLHRHDRGVKPTAAAMAILDRLHHVFALLEEIVEEVGAVGTGIRGLVRVRANMTATAGELANYIARFTNERPDVDVQLDEATTLDIIHSVRVGTCDIGIISGTVDAEGLHLVPWISDELVAVLPASHALAAKTPLQFEDILDYPFIGMQNDSALQMLYREKASIIGKDLEECAHVSSFSAVLKLVAAECGVSILPRVAVDAVRENAVWIAALSEDWARRQLALCVKSAQTTNLAKQLLNFLISHA